MLVLLDENFPHKLRLLIPGHDVRTVAYQGWQALSNGALLAAAEQAGFDVLVTADQNLTFQQNIGRRKLAVVVLSSNERENIVARRPPALPTTFGGATVFHGFHAPAMAGAARL